MSGLGCADAALYSAPRHDDSARWQPTIKNLIPSHQPPSMLLKKSADLFKKPPLQRLLIWKPKLLYVPLYLGASFPLVLDRFVAADMDSGAGEDRQRLGQHVLQEAERGICWIEEVRMNPPGGGNLD